MTGAARRLGHRKGITFCSFGCSNVEVRDAVEELSTRCARREALVAVLIVASICLARAGTASEHVPEGCRAKQPNSPSHRHDNSGMGEHTEKASLTSKWRGTKDLDACCDLVQRGCAGWPFVFT